MLLLFYFAYLSSSFGALDAHVHFYSHKPENVLRQMELSKRNGITHSFAFSWSFGAEIREVIGPFQEMPVDEFVQIQNTFIASVQKKYPDSFTAFCSIPWRYEKSKALVELNRCVEIGMKGLKVYPFTFRMTSPGRYISHQAEYDTNILDMEFLNLLIAFASEHQMIFAIHSAEMDVNRLLAFLYGSHYKYTKDMKVVFLHGFAGQDFSSLNLLRDHLTYMPDAHLFIELSNAQIYMNGPLEKQFKKTVNSIGVGHILFGSDSAYYVDYPEQLKALEMYRMLFKRHTLKDILANKKILER